MADGLSISDLLRYSREQLREASQERRAVGDKALFRVEQMVIEVNVVASESREKKGGLDLKVLTAGAAKNYSQQQVHKITISLRAKDPDEPEYLDDLEEE